MVDQLVLDLVEKRLVAGSISLYVGYAKGPGERAGESDGAFFDGGHGRRPASGRRGFSHTGSTRRQADRTNLYSKLMPRFLDLFDETTRRDAPIRLQQAVLAVKGRFGKNALLRGTSLKEKATARERNEQIGGHHA